MVDNGTNSKTQNDHDPQGVDLNTYSQLAGDWLMLMVLVEAMVADA
jgi:hypothetical protein